MGPREVDIVVVVLLVLLVPLVLLVLLVLVLLVLVLVLVLLVLVLLVLLVPLALLVLVPLALLVLVPLVLLVLLVLLVEPLTLTPPPAEEVQSSCRGALSMNDRLLISCACTASNSFGSSTGIDADDESGPLVGAKFASRPLPSRTASRPAASIRQWMMRLSPSCKPQVAPAAAVLCCRRRCCCCSM
jgi:hypothetical protein